MPPPQGLAPPQQPQVLPSARPHWPGMPRRARLRAGGHAYGRSDNANRLVLSWFTRARVPGRDGGLPLQDVTPILVLFRHTRLHDAGCGQIMNDAIGGNAGQLNGLTALGHSSRGAPRLSSTFIRRSAMRARLQGHGRVAMLDSERLGFATFSDCAFDGRGCVHSQAHGVRTRAGVCVELLGRGSFAGQGFSRLKVVRLV